MSCKYSIELREIVSDPLFNLFDFDYPFYSEDLELKESFEDRFIEHYYFHEIGFETVARFKHALRSKLRDVMPYYAQLYKSELQAKGVNFLTNKDLREEFIREITGNNSTNIQSESESSSDVKSKTNSKISNLDNGVSSVSLHDGNLTGVSQDDTENSSTSKAESGSKTSNERNQTEKTVFVSQGNIGITPTAHLLKSWRDVMINIQLQLIEEMNDLFMMVY